MNMCMFMGAVDVKGVCPVWGGTPHLWSAREGRGSLTWPTPPQKNLTLFWFLCIIFYQFNLMLLNVIIITVIILMMVWNPTNKLHFLQKIFFVSTILVKYLQQFTYKREHKENKTYLAYWTWSCAIYLKLMNGSWTDRPRRGGSNRSQFMDTVRSWHVWWTVHGAEKPHGDRTFIVNLRKVPKLPRQPRQQSIPHLCQDSFIHTSL